MAKAETVADRYVKNLFEEGVNCEPFEIDNPTHLAIIAELARYAQTNPRHFDAEAQLLLDRVNASSGEIKEYFSLLLESPVSYLIQDRTQYIQ